MVSHDALDLGPRDAGEVALVISGAGYEQVPEQGVFVREEVRQGRGVGGRTFEQSFIIADDVVDLASDLLLHDVDRLAVQVLVVGLQIAVNGFGAGFAGFHIDQNSSNLPPLVQHFR